MTATGSLLPDGTRRFTTIWSRVVHPLAHSALPRPEFERLLLPLTQRLFAALHAQPFDPTPGREVGAALVAAGCTDPNALPQILGVVDAYLLLYCQGGAPLPVDEGRARCARLQHAIAAGYANALRDRTRAETWAIARTAAGPGVTADLRWQDPSHRGG